MRGRLYPESIPVLASYWLKTVYYAGHDRRWWKELHRLLRQAQAQPLPEGPAGEALAEVQAWIKLEVLDNGKLPVGQPAASEPLRAPRPERLAPYLSRLLNEWLSAEIAGMLVDESTTPCPQEGGIPALIVANAIERLLLRERLARETLEAFLQPDLLSPRDVYPADAEILGDVVLYLLGRTGAPARPVMPATMLSAAGSSLPADFAGAVRRAAYNPDHGDEEIRVPLAAEQALRVLHTDRVRIGSTIVTMDGRWWESESVQSGDRHCVVYKPAGRLRIDSSHDHARLRIPYPAMQLDWPGAVRLPAFELFGRQWQAGSWETDGRRTWLDLVFAGTLPVERILPAAETSLGRSHPASIDRAWAALETALAAAMAQKSRDPIEQMRRGEFIPLARALFGLADLVKVRWTPDREALATQLRAIAYQEAEVALTYGRIPWRIVPAHVQTFFLKRRLSPELLGLLARAFEGLPPVLGGTRSTPPSQAA